MGTFSAFRDALPLRSVVVDQSGSLINFQINGVVLLANCLYRDAHNIVTYALLTEF